MLANSRCVRLPNAISTARPIFSDGRLTTRLFARHSPRLSGKLEDRSSKLYRRIMRKRPNRGIPSGRQVGPNQMRKRDQFRVANSQTAPRLCCERLHGDALGQTVLPHVEPGGPQATDHSADGDEEWVSMERPAQQHRSRCSQKTANNGFAQGGRPCVPGDG